MKPKPIMKGMAERVVYKLIASSAAIGSHAYCAEAKSSC
jgi:hypothetical protein